MSKGSYFSSSFWDSSVWRTLRGLESKHLRVYLHLAHGPTTEVSGIYRISLGQIAEDTGLETDDVDQVIGELTETGWCDYEHPIVWIIGAGNINEKLGTKDFRRNPSWLRSTEKHLDSLPPNRLVEAFRRYHGICDSQGEGVDTLSTGCGQAYSSSCSSPSLPPHPSPSPTADEQGDA